MYGIRRLTEKNFEANRREPPPPLTPPFNPLLTPRSAFGVSFDIESKRQHAVKATFIKRQSADRLVLP